MSTDFKLKGLSVVIIAKNAEKTISRCLQSVAGIAKEIVVVINDCTDDTKNIAEMYGAKVVEHEWEGFRDQKNFAISLAQGEWILSIDSDEAISEQLAVSIKAFINTPNQQFSAARLSKKTFFLNKWVSYGDWCPSFSIRLFRNGTGKFVGGSVHERLEVTGKTKDLIGDRLHFPCESFLEFTKRNICYADMGANDLFAKGERSTALSAILRSYWKFFRCYVLKFGFLDGATGFYIAKSQAFLTLYKYFKLRDLTLNK